MFVFKIAIISIATGTSRVGEKSLIGHMYPLDFHKVMNSEMPTN